MTPPLRSPDAVKADLARRFQRHRRAWLRGDGDWPLTVALGNPTEKDVLQHLTAVQQWSSAWQAWQGPGELRWMERRYALGGAHRWPTHLMLPDAAAVAAWIGERKSWQQVSERYRRLVARWPVLADQANRLYDVLAAYDEADFDRLVRLLAWLAENPHSGLLPRQLPIAGVHSKWLEPRQGLIRDLVAAVMGQSPPLGDFHAVCGLRHLPYMVRLRLLDSALRARVGGLDHLLAPIEEVARLALPLRSVLVVENLQTGLALPDLPGTVAILALGYTVDALGRLPWLVGARCYYWGDIDTHGFAILNRARGYVPGLQSLLMDEGTLLQHRDLWVEEPSPCPDQELPHLTDAENALYRDLQEGRWGTRVRLEQERIAWDAALAALRAALG